MMRQLALDIRLAEHAVFDAYYPGTSGLALASLRNLARGDGPAVIWIWGSPGTGKTHLLQASVAQADQLGRRCAYLPLGKLLGRTPGILDGLGSLDLVALDDISAIAGRGDWERAVFRLYEDMAHRSCHLLAAGDAPPAQTGFELPDLGSRMAAGGVFRLEQLSDEECLKALRHRAEWLGLALPEEVGRYLLTRLDRNAARLFQMLDKLDRAALAAQKRLTVPFVRSVLDA